jgi:hypothetical protein
MPGVTDQHHGVASGGEPTRLGVHLGDQRARRVDRLQTPAGGLRPHRRGHAVGGEHHGRAIGYGVQLVDEHRSARLQISNHMSVVHDLLAHIDRAAPRLEQLLDNRDGAFHPGAKRPW